MNDKWETMAPFYTCNGTIETLQLEGTNLLCLTDNGVEKVDLTNYALFLPLLPERGVDQ